MRESAHEFGWTYVETHRREFIGRSICAGLSVEGVSAVDDLRLPRKIDGMWTPYNPADYRPYAARQRWFRTPNDAFMTGNFHAAAGFLAKYLKIEPFAPFQAILASTYSGAFHPTAEGQAAIADAVTDKARAILAKYGQGPDSEPAGYSVPSSSAAPPPVAEPNVEIPDVKSVLSKVPDTGAGNKAAITGAIPNQVSPPPDDSDVGAPDPEDKPPPMETIGVTSGPPGSEPPPASTINPPPSTAATATTGPMNSIELRRSALPPPTQPATTPPTTGAPVPLATTVTPGSEPLPPVAAPPATATGPAVSQSSPAVESKALAPVSPEAPPTDEFSPKPFAPAAGGN